MVFRMQIVIVSPGKGLFLDLIKHKKNTRLSISAQTLTASPKLVFDVIFKGRGDSPDAVNPRERMRRKLVLTLVGHGHVMEERNESGSGMRGMLKLSSSAC